MVEDGVLAVVLAAGKSTRMRSARPKALHDVAGRRVLDHVLSAVAGAGVGSVAIVIGHQGGLLRDAFSGEGRCFFLQDPPRGTGDAVRVAREAFAGAAGAAVLVVAGDLPLLRAETLARLLRHHQEAGAKATVLSFCPTDAAAYGRVLRGGDGRVEAIVEARDASPAQLAVGEVNSGVYVFEAAALDLVLGELAPANAQQEYYLTDAIGLLVGRGLPVEALRADDPDEVLGVNTLAELAEAERLLFARRTGVLLASGVRIEAPETVQIGPEVVVEPDAWLRRGTLLEGRTRVASGAQIGPYSRIEDGEIGADARVLDHCLLRQCVVEAGASVGPFAHIRPDSRVGAGARVGNFVELKGSSLGAGAKVPHLSYVGNATVGERANVGAGTITCNYDGVHKHPTRIGAGAFVGSNSTLVAPVTVGEGAYVAAGSAVTEDVPDDALALGRARQVVKRGWAARRRRDGS